MNRQRHKLDFGILTEDASTFDRHPLLFEVPVESVCRKVVPIVRLNPADQLRDGFLRISNDRSPSRNDQVWLLSRDFFQTRNQHRQPRRVTVVSADLCLGNRILKTVKINQFPIAVNQVACECDAFPTNVGNVRHRSASETWSFQNSKIHPAHFEAVSIFHRSINSQRSGQNLCRLLSVVMEPFRPESVPKFRGRFKKSAFRLRSEKMSRRNDVRSRNNNIPAMVRHQQVGDVFCGLIRA